jgi:hypothetical protein
MRIVKKKEVKIVNVIDLNDDVQRFQFNLRVG